MIKPSSSRGMITSYVLVFGSIFLLLFSALSGFIVLQLKNASRKVALEQALHIAEAGINYYRWCMNNGIEDNCQLQKDYLDSGGNIIGTFSLNIDSQESCSIKGPTTIISTGQTEKFPEMERKVQLLHAKSSVAEYSYLLNDNVWAGSDREITGLYHSNGGIRMDGENQSLVTSAQEEWVCTSSFGCSTCPTDSTPPCHLQGSDCICSGVFTATDNAKIDLFNNPVPPFDFEGITIDLAQIKSITQPYLQQYYWPIVTDIDPEGEGYHLKFLNDGTFEIWIITNLQSSYAYNTEEDWHYDYFIINNEYRYGNPIAIDTDCSLIFIEDNLWIEGEVNGKVTVASANLISPGQDTDVILSGNIGYATLGGDNGLSVIGENNVLIPPNSPDTMELKGIFVAQKGRFGRNHYSGNIKEKLEIYGSIVSNGRVGTKWSSGGQVVSGYLKRENYFDPSLVYSPPLFTPYTVSEFEIVNWEELE